jgi:hypothetical protein
MDSAIPNNPRIHGKTPTSQFPALFAVIGFRRGVLFLSGGSGRMGGENHYHTETTIKPRIAPIIYSEFLTDLV